MYKRQRLYYPLSSLNHFFEAEDSEAEMLARLSGFPASLTKKLGNVTVTAKKDRFCVHIPEDGSVYVHEHTDANEFIRSLIELLQHHGCTMDLSLIHIYSIRQARRMKYTVKKRFMKDIVIVMKSITIIEMY